MNATTVKLDEELLRQIQTIKSPKQTLARFVKQAVASEIHRRRMSRAAEEYERFLAEHPEEAHALQEWEAAPLGEDIDLAQT